MTYFMKKYDLHNAKSIIKYIIYVTSVVTACYGFWGCLFPDLTLVEGTYRVVSSSEDAGEVLEDLEPGRTGGAVDRTAKRGETVEDAEKLYADILEGRVTVVYRSKLWEIIKSKCGWNND